MKIKNKKELWDIKTIIAEIKNYYWRVGRYWRGNFPENRAKALRI